MSTSNKIQNSFHIFDMPWETNAFSGVRTNKDVLMQNQLQDTRTDNLNFTEIKTTSMMA